MKRKVSWAAALAGMAVAAGVLSSALPSTASERAAAVSAAPAVPVLAWKPCDDGFQCATARVPLNYRDPRGAQISIAVISHKATGPGRSLGWLFFNGGGPEPQVSTMSSVYPPPPGGVAGTVQHHHLRPARHGLQHPGPLLPDGSGGAGGARRAAGVPSRQGTGSRL
jgi:hypothetical protein